VVLYNPASRTRALPLSLVHIASVLPGRPIAIVDGRLDLAPEARVAELAREASCLGVTVPTGAPIRDALRVTQAARAERPDLPVVWGGWHPSLMPEQCLAAEAVDGCVVGQGERTFCEVLEALDDGASLAAVPGIVWRRGGDVVRNAARPFEDVNRFPRADFELLDMERYFSFMGMRRLDYCSSQSRTPPLDTGPEPNTLRWSGLRADRVVEEVAEHARRYRLAEVLFSDDDFFLDPERVQAICAGLVMKGDRIPWSGTGRTAVLARLADDQLRIMKESGCHRVHVQVSWPASADLARRREEVLGTAERLNRFQIGGRFSFVVGFPQEPPASLEETYKTVKALRQMNREFETPISFFAPYPGSEWVERMQALGLLTPRSLEEWAELESHTAKGGNWVPEQVRKKVPRYNFYVRHGYSKSRGGIGRRLLGLGARVRVKTNFFGLDIERQLVGLLERLATQIEPHQPVAPEDW